MRRIYNKDFVRGLKISWEPGYPTLPPTVTPPVVQISLLFIVLVSLQDWREFDYVVFANLNIFHGYTDKLYAETINKLFRY